MDAENFEDGNKAGVLLAALVVFGQFTSQAGASAGGAGSALGSLKTL
jgi:hypothetical protein